MTRVQSHRDLIVWQKSMDLAEQVYRITKTFPVQETYGLTAQMTRAVVSVAANIAEGCARATSRDFAYFLSIAKGSLMETETFLLLAVRINYMSKESSIPLLDLITEISKMLTSMRNKIAQS